MADFDRDSHADYALFKPATDQTVIVYLSGPTLYPGWTLVGAAELQRRRQTGLFALQRKPVKRAILSEQ